MVLFLLLKQARLTRYEQLVDDVSTHCLEHNSTTDSLTQLVATLTELEGQVKQVVGSEQAREVDSALHECNNRIAELQTDVNISQQRSEKVLEELAKQDRDTVRKQSQVTYIIRVF